MATVDTLIAQAQAYVTTVTASADNAVSNMRDDIDSVGFTVIVPGITGLPNEPEIPEITPSPTLDTINLDLATEPSSDIDFTVISQIERGTLPVLTAAAPTIVPPTLPVQLTAFAETPPPITTEFDFPVIPARLDDVVSEPILGTYTTPVKPTIALPSFDATAPDDTLTVPTNLAGTLDTQWRNASPMFVAALKGQMDAMLTEVNPQFHTQMAAIETQLTAYLAGGTGFSPTVENAIYAKSAGVNAAEHRRTADAAWQESASRGFTMPGGSILSGLQRSRQSYADKQAALAGERLVKAYEVEQQNLQFAVTTSSGLRQTMLSAALSYHGSLVQINGQALSYAQAILSAIVEAFNLEVKAFAARLDAYKTEANVFDVRLKAALSYIDLYKAEIDALQALVQVDQAKVSMYKGRIDALQALAGVYKSRIDAVVSQASLEKLKLDLFRAKTDAYGLQVQNKRFEYDAHSAAIQGNDQLVRLYLGQLGAYNAQLDGFKADISAQAEVVRAQSLTNEAKADQVKADVSVYEATTRARSDVVRSKIAIQGQQLSVVDGQNRVAIAKAEVENSIYQTIANVTMANKRNDMDGLIKNAETNLGRTKAVADLGIASAEIYKGLAGAALSGLNTLVSQNKEE